MTHTAPRTYAGKLVSIGRIRPDERLAIHLAVDGRPACDGARVLAAEVTDPQELVAGRRCRRCFAPERVADARAVNSHSDHRFSATADAALFELACPGLPARPALAPAPEPQRTPDRARWSRLDALIAASQTA